MTGHELANKLLTMPDVTVTIQIEVVNGGGELTGNWTSKEWRDVGGVDDLETKIVLTPAEE